MEGNHKNSSKESRSNSLNHSGNSHNHTGSNPSSNHENKSNNQLKSNNNSSGKQISSPLSSPSPSPSSSSLHSSGREESPSRSPVSIHRPSSLFHPNYHQTIDELSRSDHREKGRSSPSSSVDEGESPLVKRRRENDDGSVNHTRLNQDRNSPSPTTSPFQPPTSSSSQFDPHNHHMNPFLRQAAAHYNNAKLMSGNQSRNYNPNDLLPNSSSVVHNPLAHHSQLANQSTAGHHAAVIQAENLRAAENSLRAVNSLHSLHDSALRAAAVAAHHRLLGNSFHPRP